jgi:hypothetical protein
LDLNRKYNQDGTYKGFFLQHNGGVCWMSPELQEEIDKQIIKDFKNEQRL